MSPFSVTPTSLMYVVGLGSPAEQADRKPTASSTGKATRRRFTRVSPDIRGGVRGAIFSGLFAQCKSTPLARVAASMAEVRPLRTLRYDAATAGPLEDVIAPPYDVIDDELRARLVARSPYNVVEIDLPAHGRRRPLRARRGHHGRVARERSAGPRGRAGGLGPAPGLHRPGWPRPLADGLPGACAGGGVRPGPDPAPRAHPSRAQGGPPAAHPRHAHEPLPHLQPLPGPGWGRSRVAREACRRRALCRRQPTTRAPATRSGGSPTPPPSTASGSSSPTPSC